MTDEKETQLALMAQKFDTLHEDVSEMKDALKEVARALNKLTLVEERQAQVSDAQKKMYEKLESIEGRVIALEKTEVHQSQITNWITNAACGLIGVIAMYAAKKLGLM
jgi:chromosome segregation ATPase